MFERAPHGTALAPERAPKLERECNLIRPCSWDDARALSGEVHILREERGRGSRFLGRQPKILDKHKRILAMENGLLKFSIAT